jgi:hypothetical protein
VLGQAGGHGLILVGVAAFAGAFFNDRYGDRLTRSRRSQLTESERHWIEGGQKERTTLVRVVIGALFLIGGIVSVLVQASGT